MVGIGHEKGFWLIIIQCVHWNRLITMCSKNFCLWTIFFDYWDNRSGGRLEPIRRRKIRILEQTPMILLLCHSSRHLLSNPICLSVCSFHSVSIWRDSFSLTLSIDPNWDWRIEPLTRDHVPCNWMEDTNDGDKHFPMNRLFLDPNSISVE